MADREAGAHLTAATGVKRRVPRLVLAGAVAACACARIGSSPSTGADSTAGARTSAPHEGSPAVVLRQAGPGAPWRVTYGFGRPVVRLRFERPAGFFREEHWRVLTPGFVLAREGDLQVVRTEAGRAADSLTLELAVHTAPLAREYESFLAFSDGSLAVYTGHLNGMAFTESGDSVRIRDFVLSAAGGDHVVVPGASPAASLAWTDAPGQGTYAYFGSGVPAETPDMMLLMDRGLPDWLARTAEAAIPAFFRIYAERIGVDVPARPLVLLGRDPSPAPGLNSGGGVLPGLIQLMVQGDAWTERSPRAATQALHFIAHEAAHVWNGDYARSADPAESWMHEGGADAFADRALLASGLIDREEFDTRATRAANLCSAELGGRALRSAARGAPAVSYACGNVMALWTEAALRTASGGDLFAFWGELIGRAVRTGGTYDQAAYLETALDLGLPHGAAAALARLADTDHGDTAGLLAEGLAAAGVEVTRDPVGDASYRQEWGRRLFSALMLADCGGVSFYGGGGAYRVAGGLTCGALREGAEVSRAEGLPLVEDGGRAYDAVRAACPASGSVSIGLADGSAVDVPCPAELLERTPALRIRTGD